MSYGIKYWLSYKRASNNTTTINILEEGYSGSTTELQGNTGVLEIDFTGNINNIYEPTRGSGAQIKLLVEPLTLHNEFFTQDPQKWMVQIYSGSTGTTLPVWQGFINTGIYNEDYSSSGLVPITITCNDGFGVLEQLSYRVSETGATFTGFVTVAEVLGNIWDKIGLNYNYMICNSNLQISYALDYVNPFIYLTVNQENFLDEKGIAMSCREVLNTIFNPLGIVITFGGKNIYFIDPINLNDASTGHVYNMNGTFYSDYGLQGVGSYLDLSLGEISYYKTGQFLDIIQPFNQVKITYDPYTITEAGYDFNEEGNATNPDTYGTYTDNGVTYKVYTDNTMLDWTYTGVYGFEANEEITPNEIDIDYYIRRDESGTATYSHDFPYTLLKQDDNIKLLLSMDVYVNTNHVSNVFDPVDLGHTLSSLNMDGIQFKVGEHYWNSWTGKWQTTEASETRILVRELDADIIAGYRVHGTWFRKARYVLPEDKSEIQNRWVTALLYIDISEASATDIGFISGSTSVIISRNIAVHNPDIQNIRVKNINLEVLKSNKGDVINDTIETTATLYEHNTMKKSPLKVDLKCGIGPYGASKGAYSYDVVDSFGDYTGWNLDGLYRGTVVQYDTAALLSQSLLSQYKDPRIKLYINLNVKDYLLNIKNMMIRDTDYISGKQFYIVSGKYKDEEESFECEVLELVSTREAFV